ncbi:hypothetical protein BDV34DRAFT_228145 [Aspergillus parasiticus]|uniref:Uncharacterized protein n=1 Tax=Aspergillus parasiticus TaxID=5067 RepID=A0A5N6DC94_ASPPA|nr:hypothetical protein BDV34DRAFT_228145 [Aspergillus parasiticus]
MPVSQAECLVNYGCNICDIPISHESSNDFVILMPGVPFQVNHDIRPTPRGLDSIPNQPWRELSEEDASRLVLAMFTHTKGLQVGSTYCVELGERRNRIHWYRFGTKEEVLSGVGGTRRNERVGDMEMERIPLILQNEATFRVVE